MTKYKSAEACQAADVHFVEIKSTFIKEKQNLIIRKAGIEIEIPGNSNAVIIREILAAMDALSNREINTEQFEMLLDSSKTKVVMEQEHHVLFCPLLKLPSRMGLLLKIISDVFLKKPLVLKLKMTGKSFSPGILKLLHISFVENGFKLWNNYVNVNLIC